MIVERYLNVADLSIEVNRIHAIDNWLKSRGYLVFTQRHLKLALKVFAPEWICNPLPPPKITGVKVENTRKLN